MCARSEIIKRCEIKGKNGDLTRAKNRIVHDRKFGRKLVDESCAFTNNIIEQTIYMSCMIPISLILFDKGTKRNKVMCHEKHNH